MIYMASTQISCSKTAGEIMQLLSEYGIEQILTEYKDGEAIGLKFIIEKNEKSLAFQVPIRWEPVLRAMLIDKRTPNRLCTEKQARRVAWRLAKRWIEAQLAYVKIGMVSIEEVFMPYLLINPNETFYEKVANNQFKQIGMEGE